jgi:hypothetical protein
VPQFGSPAGQGHATSIPLHANDRPKICCVSTGWSQLREASPRSWNTRVSSPEACGSDCARFSLWAVHLDDPVGDNAPLGAVEDDVSKCHSAGYHRLHSDEFSLSDAGIHASSTGSEAHSGTPGSKAQWSDPEVISMRLTYASIFVLRSPTDRRARTYTSA